ncbi:type 1 periplasmic-binding domain-containing protein [Nocardia callitridis]|uniref:ABC transporter substrate-binding protein n=1 Tax=Nocardia callitridis TaxID=648753 RepID=A0ABP9KJ40_9NOCA
MSDAIVPPPPKWRPFAWAAGAVVVVILVSVGVVILVHTAMSCGQGVSWHGSPKECTGVTDGSAPPFSPDLTEIEHAIRDENAAVAADGDYVSVVLMIPMTLRGDGTDDITSSWIRHHLEGAHLAQLSHNASTSKPHMRLLLANAGSALRQWSTTVDQIDQLRDKEHIVAVTGIGLSVDGAEQAIQRLQEIQMPIIASILTADDVGGSDGFLRISPTNFEDGRAAATYVTSKMQRAVLVRDTKPADHYTSTLADAFLDSLKEVPNFPVTTREYNSMNGRVANTFSYMRPNVCGPKPDAVFFAGRGRDAIDFIRELSNNPCEGRPQMTILTGVDMALFAKPDDNLIAHARDSGISVVYTGLTHPDAWLGNEDGEFSQTAIDQFDNSCPVKVCYQQLSKDGLEDDSAIVSYDAVLTATEAIHKASGSGIESVQAEDIRAVLGQLQEKQAFHGATGILSFDFAGNPQNKAIPMLQLIPQQPPKFLQLVKPGPH